jgi:serine/threonine protein kinase
MDRRRIIVQLGLKALRSRAFRDSDAFFDEFVDMLISLGGVYAKFLQGVLIGQAYKRADGPKREHLEVFENNPDPHLSIDDLKVSLGASYHALTIDTHSPLGVGSYSAVYPARLHDGTEVIVKVLRPHIVKEVKDDLKFLKVLTYIMRMGVTDRLPVDVTQMYGSFKRACLKETDFMSEIAFAHELYTRYKGHQYLRIPKTYTDLSSATAIVQERISGISLADVLMNKSASESSEAYVRRTVGSELHALLRSVSYEMFYAFGTGASFHGDVHPGNVRILHDNKIALIDFGIKADPYAGTIVHAYIQKLESDMLFMKGDFDLVRTLQSHFRFYMAHLYSSIESLYYYAKKDMREFFTTLAEELNIHTDTVDEKTKHEWLCAGPVRMLNSLLGDAKKYGIDVKVTDHSTTRACSTLFSLLTATVGARERHMTVMYPVYEAVTHNVRTKRPELFTPKKHMMPDLALESIYAWIEKIAIENPRLAGSLRASLLNSK